MGSVRWVYGLPTLVSMMVAVPCWFRPPEVPMSHWWFPWPFVHTAEEERPSQLSLRDLDENEIAVIWLACDSRRATMALKLKRRPPLTVAVSAPSPAPAEPDATAEPDAPAEEAVAPAGADEADAAEDGAAAVPGMSPEAAARLAEAKLREELLGRVEGQYKLRGETCPLSVQKQTVAELEATLAELRGERADE